MEESLGLKTKSSNVRCRNGRVEAEGGRAAGSTPCMALREV